MSGDYKYLVNNPTAISDGLEAYPRGGHLGQGIVSQMCGPYYEQVRRGLVFIATTAAAGLALPIYSATAQLFMLWNPANSLVNLELIAAIFGRVSGTDTDGHLCWGYKTSMGSSLATGAPCSAFTAGTPVNALLGGAADSVSNFAPATATVTAPGYLRPSLTTGELADAGVAMPALLVEHFHHNPVVLAPGSAIFAAKNLTSGTTWTVSLIYAKVPV